MLTIKCIFLILVLSQFNIFKEVEYPVPVMDEVHFLSDVKTPEPVMDTNVIADAVNYGAIDIGKFLKSPSDDTIRIILSRGSLYICTDTSTSSFGPYKFRVQKIHDFPYTTIGYSTKIGKTSTSDTRNSIFATYGDNFYRFQWDPTISNWALKESIYILTGLGENATNIDIGYISNYNYYDIFIPRTDYSELFWIRYKSSGYDTSNISLSGTPVQQVRGVAVGDVRSDIGGIGPDEVYVVGGKNLWVVWYDEGSSQWNSELITNNLLNAVDVVVGDIDPTLSGNEIAILHDTTSYQISIWNYSGGLWFGRSYNILGLNGSNDIALGDVISDNPGYEIIFVNKNFNYPLLCYIAPNGFFWAELLTKTSNWYAGVAIGNVNKFKGVTEEYVISGNFNNLYEGEQLISPYDLCLFKINVYYYSVLRTNYSDNISFLIVNSGSNQISNFTCGYYLLHHSLNHSGIYTYTLNPGDTAIYEASITPNFRGVDTIVAFVDYTFDGNRRNDTCKLHIEVYDDSTWAASGFNAGLFPPVLSTLEEPLWSYRKKWTSYNYGFKYNWYRTSLPAHPSAPVLEGYAVAYYPSFYASSGESALLLTNETQIRNTAKKVNLVFYMYHDTGYSALRDSIYVKYGFDSLNLNKVAGFQRPYSIEQWQKHTVEIGDFSPGRSVFVGFLARSKYGNNIFIDSVRVYTSPSTTDGGVTSIRLPKPPYIQNNFYWVEIKIKNFGPRTLTSVPVFYVSNKGTSSGETYSGTLNTNDSANFVFTIDWQPLQTGIDTIRSFSLLEGDYNTSNDTTFKEIMIWPEYKVPPYSTNFEENWSNSSNPPYDGWEIIDGGSESPEILNTNDWHKYLLNTSYRFSNVARVFWSPVEWSNDWLISPRFNCTQQGIYVLHYWHYYNDYTTSRTDSGNVMLSTDGGNSWTRIALYQNADDSGYKTIDITSYAQGKNNVKIGFWYVANDEFFWYIDSFSIDFTPTGIAEEIPKNVYFDFVFNKNNASIHYGIPVDGNVSFKIYNLLGQIVKSIDKGNMKAGRYEETVYLDIPDGIYFVNMEIGKEKITKKYIKLF